MRVHTTAFFVVVLTACAADPDVSTTSGDANPSDASDSGDGSVDVTVTDAVHDTADATLDTSDAGSSDVPDTYDAGPAAVTVVVRNEIAVETGVIVLFQDATGVVLSSTTTDATGSASAIVPTGSQVTALVGSPQQARITTVTQVEPGDLITVVDTLPKEAFAENLQLIAAPSSPPSGTAMYIVNHGGNGYNYSTLPVTIFLSGAGESAGEVPILVEAANSSVTPLAYSYLKSFALPTTLDAGADASEPSVIVTMPWQTTMYTDTMTFTGPMSANGRVVSSEVVSGIPFSQSDSLGSSEEDAGTYALRYAHHAGFADAIQDSVVVETMLSIGIGYVGLATSVTPPTADSTTAIDLTTTLPAITAATIDATNVARPIVAWTSAGALGNAGGFARFSWDYVTDGGYGAGTWTIVVPASATTVTAPQLPASAAAWLPTIATSYQNPPTVEFVDGASIPNYGALRTLSPTIPLFDVKTNDGDFPMLPAGGALRLTAFFPNGT